MKTKLIEKEIKYTGLELAPHWIYKNFNIQGDAIVAFMGGCDVKLDHMVDIEDVLSNSPIYSEKMLHFIESKNGNVIHHDQGVINACFEDDILILPPHYNVMTSFFDFRDVESIKHYYGITNYYSQNDIIVVFL